MWHWFEHYQVYHPDRVLRATGAELLRPFENVFFQTADGVRLNGWFFPSQAAGPRAEMALMLCHGNGGNVSYRLDVYDVLLSLGLNLLVFDYRGYGLSQGRPSEEGTYQDALAAHQWLQQKGFGPGKIIALGESLGGGVATELAARAQCGGLILQNTFTCIPDIGAELFPWLPVRLLARIKYDTVRKLPKLKLPVLILHSRADALVRFAHAELNFAAANEPKLLWEIKGHHSDPLADREQFIAGIEKLLSLTQQAHASAGQPPPAVPE